MRALTFNRLIVASLIVTPASLSAQAIDSLTLAGMRWRNVGPATFEGRIADITGIPFPSRTFFVAAAAGGIWKTTNGGVTFRPVFDNYPVISMGALAIAPSDTMQVWAGTGEQNSRNSIEPGGGLYKSADGGITWRLMGLEKTQHIGRIAVHPRNPNVVYVAALGAAWATNPERGLYKTEDGGQTWRIVKFISDRAGFVDVALDPSNPDVVWASSYERIRGPYYLISGGPGSALWKSTDAGATWTEIKGGGFPATTKGRISFSIYPGNSRIVYAMVEADSTPNPRPTAGQAQQQLNNGLYRTQDGGTTWEKTNDANVRPFYYSQVRVHPTKPNRLWFSSTPLIVSDEGGRNGRQAAVGVHIDTHALWIDPGDPEHMVIGNDGGVYITWDGGGAWDFGETLPVSQFYEVSYDYRVPYYICGGAQDNGSHCGPSRRQGNNQNSYWFMVSGGDGFYTAQHPREPWVVWSESQGGNMQRRNIRTGEGGGLARPTYRAAYVAYEDSIMEVRGDTTRPATREQTRRIAELRQRQVADSIESNMRYNWNNPFLLSPHNPDVFYSGGSRVLKSTWRGDNLFAISPDLSKKQWGKIDTSMTKTGGVTRDATGAETYGTVVALAESYVTPGWLIAGTDDGNVWVTRNDGKDWEQIPMSRFPGIATGDIYSGKIEPSHFDANTFYITFDNHRNNDFAPYVYVTNNFGRSFRSIVNNLPRESQADYARVLREDPHNRDLLFLGTSRTVYVSLDRGAIWTPFRSAMPHVPIYDLQIHPRDRELIAATHGRSFWIVDINPLEQMAGSLGTRVVSSPAYLFEPRVAYDYGEGPNMGESFYGVGQKTFQSPSPPHGAEISYRLGRGAMPAGGGGAGGRGGRGGAGGGVSVLISDVSGDTVAVLNGPGTPGLHKITWNFRGRPSPVMVTLSPSQTRDSVNVARRINAIFDSATAAGSLQRDAADRMRTAMLSGNLGGGGRGFGGGGGGGRGGAGPAGWVERPGEGGPVGRGGRGGGGGGVDLFADFPGGAERLAELMRPRGAPPFAGRGGGAGEIALRLSAFTGGGGGGRGGGRGGGAGAPLMPPGDYLVTLTVGGQSYSRKLRVERMEGFGEVAQ
ncbi:MAG TPA: hypothetical protein VF981_07505 [Gemmatimonadaceae bacterium]